MNTKDFEKKELAAAIIGPGYIGSVHAEALRRLGITIRTVVGRTSEKAKMKSREFKALQSSSFEEALNDPDVNVIHICTPNYLHYSEAKDALLAGKHVICEKPVTLSVNESRELVNLSKEKNLIFAVCYCYRYYPLVEQMRQLIKKNSLGPLTLVHGRYLADELLTTDYMWRVSPEWGGESIAMADIGIHWCDLAEYVTGQKIIKIFADFQTVISKRIWQKGAPGSEKIPESLQAEEDAKVGEVPITGEDSLNLLLCFDGGARGNAVISQVAPGRKNCIDLEIEGMKAGVSWNQEEPNALLLRRRESTEIIYKDDQSLHPRAAGLTTYPAGHPEGYADSFRNMLEDIYRNIEWIEKLEGSDHNFPNVEDGHRGMLFIEAAIQSARSGRWVEIPAL